MKNKRSVIIAVLLLFSLAQSVFAFQFTPITKDFDSTGNGTRQTFRITNDTGNPVGVQMEAMSRDMDEHGEETLTEASSLFHIYPRQVVVQPGSYQTVRVQWRGPAQIETERPFRIVAKQLPLNFDSSQEGASLNILLTYRGTMYVVPEDIEFDLKLLSVRQHTTQDGTKKLAIEMKNDGNVHQIMYQPQFTVVSRDDSGSVTSRVNLGPDELRGLSGENILAGKRRIFLVPWPDELKEGNLDATYQMENTR